MEKWKNKSFWESLTLKEKLFRIISSMGIAAMIMAIASNVLLQESIYILIFLLIGFAALLFSFWINVKYNKMNLAAIIMTIVVDWIMFPIIYFTSGGIDSGATVWFVIGIIFVFLLFEGKELVVMLLITVGVFLMTYLYGYAHPEAIIPMETSRDVAFDSAFAVFIVSFSIGILIKFQNRVYDDARKVTEQQKKELEEINMSKSSFFANMSHEIRTPINTIIGLNEMTLREDISDEIAENSINIQNASKMLLSLINDILDLSKIESGKMEIVPVQYETGAMFSELINIIWIRAHEKNLEFKLDVDKNIPSMLYGDEVRLRQILINILTNAVKYTKEGSVTLAASCERRDLNEVDLKISVIDTGMGIRKESMSELFSSFKRVDQKKNNKIEGTGLGLSISKQLIDLMGGKIEVDSIYTKGSTFTVTVRQKIVNDEPIGVIDSLLKRKKIDREQYKQSFEAPDARVLIVDDNEMNLLVARKLLRSTKVQIDTASSGKECLEMTQNKNYHVIFMDHKMPEMDGVETLSRIRDQENGRCQNIPVIALTANVMSGAEQIYQDYGFEGYLAKPINGALFEAMLLRYLPSELIEYSKVTGNTIDTDIQMIKGKHKKAIYVTADCVCDIPQKYIEEYDIGIMPYYVVTNEGQFRDINEIQANNLLDYLSVDGNQARSHAAPEEEYESFFADALEKAEQVIHITIANGIRDGGAEARAAVRGFNHVTVYNSGHLSSGMGLIVLAAVKMAMEHKSVEEIVQTMDHMKKRISTSFIVPSIQSLYASGLVGSKIACTCNLLSLRPVLVMNKGEMKCGSIEVGDTRNCYRKYIRHVLKRRNKIDTRVVFITYAGCSIKQLHEFSDEVLKYVKFEKVIYQQASATISCNCGLGAMGVIFIRKNE